MCELDPSTLGLGEACFLGTEEKSCPWQAPTCTHPAPALARVPAGAEAPAVSGRRSRAGVCRGRG